MSVKRSLGVTGTGCKLTDGPQQTPTNLLTATHEPLQEGGVSSCAPWRLKKSSNVCASRMDQGVGLQELFLVQKILNFTVNTQDEIFRNYGRRSSNPANC